MTSNGSSRYDAIVIGGGHNGLVNAAYLARAGKKVLETTETNRASALRRLDEDLIAEGISPAERQAFVEENAAFMDAANDDAIRQLMIDVAERILIEVIDDVVDGRGVPPAVQGSDDGR